MRLLKENLQCLPCCAVCTLCRLQGCVPGGCLTARSRVGTEAKRGLGHLYSQERGVFNGKLYWEVIFSPDALKSMTFIFGRSLLLTIILNFPTL